MLRWLSLCALIVLDVRAENVRVSEWGLCTDEVLELAVLELGGQVVQVRRRKWRTGHESYCFTPDPKYWPQMTPDQMCALKQRLIQRHRTAVARRAQAEQLTEVRQRHKDQVDMTRQIERARQGVWW